MRGCRGCSSSHDRLSPVRIAVATRFARGCAVTLALILLTGVAPLGQEAQRASRSPKIDRALDALLTNEPGVETARVIIRTRDSRSRESLKNRLQAHGDRIEADHASIEAFTATVHFADLRALADDPATEAVSIDAVVTAHQAAASSLLGTELLPDSSATPSTGAGVRVAVIDSGLELTNDLFENRLLGFYDLTRNDQIVAAPPYDDYGHGTHVAGLIAGSGANSNGFYAGLAPAASVLAVKVLDNDGAGYTSDVIQAIDFILANRKALRIDVINLSLGHPIFESAATDPLVLAVERATRAGIVVVVAAGNYGRDPTTGLPAYAGITSPGNAPSAITVGALDTKDTIDRGDDTIPIYSSRGPTWYDAYAKPDLVAPGHRLVSVAALESTLYRSYANLRVVGKTGDLARYFRLSGTSMATAVTSGAVALMLDAAGKNRKFFTPNLVKALLEWSALPMAGYDALTQGSGSLNVAGALALVREIDPTMPVGTYWLTANVTPSTTIAGTTWLWGQSVLWGNGIGYGSLIDTNHAAWGNTVIWGSGKPDTVIWGNKAKDTVIWGNKHTDTVIWGNKAKDTVIWGNKHTDTVIWGNDVVWDNPLVWSSSLVWGNQLIGTLDGTTVIWGNTHVTPSTVIWGNLSTVTGVNAISTFADIQQ
jgi:serine protease AprX